MNSSMEPFEFRSRVVEQLSLTTAEIRIRDPEVLLSERYPCVMVEDNPCAHSYRVRLIFGVECLSFKPIEVDGRDQEELFKMFVVFKAWAQFNLKKIFTSLEVHFIYRHLVKKVEGPITLYKLLKAFVEVDPVRGILWPEYEGQLQFSQFMPVRRVVDNEAKHVDLREMRR